VGQLQLELNFRYWKMLEIGIKTERQQFQETRLISDLELQVGSPYCL